MAKDAEIDVAVGSIPLMQESTEAHIAEIRNVATYPCTSSSAGRQQQVQCNGDNNQKIDEQGDGKELSDHLRGKMSGQMDVTLPSTPSATTSLIALCEEQKEDDESDNDAQAPAIDSNLLIENMEAPAFVRLKTRLQDPPPLTPALANKLNSAVEEPSLPKIISDSNAMAPPSAPIPAPPPPSSPPLIPAQEKGDGLDEESTVASAHKKSIKVLMIVQWCSLLVLVTLLICSNKIVKLEKVTFLGLNLWRWQALTLVIFCGHLISGWIIKLLVLCIERHYLLKKKVLYFVYGLRHSVKNCIWLALVLGVWEVIFQGHEDTAAVNILTKILWCLFTASVSWMMKILAVKVAATNFHRTAYFDRIQDCLFSQYVLEKLSAPSVMSSVKFSNNKQAIHQGNTQTSYSRNDGVTLIKQPSTVVGETENTSFHNVIDVGCQTPPMDTKGCGPQFSLHPRSESSIPHEKLQELTSETVSVWTLKRLMKTIRNTNLKTYSSILSHGKGDTVIQSEVQAKIVAKQIFQNLVKPGEKFISIETFMYFLPKDQVRRAFSMFEANENGEISKSSFTKWVVNVYKERRALCLTLSDNKTVVAKLHRIFNGLLSSILLAAFVLIFGVDTSKVLLFLSSVVLPSVFIFGNTARNAFESIIFLFITHPFDVGDQVVVDGQPLLVEEINVLNTIFLSSSNEKIYYPNSTLSVKPISNYYRSPDQWDSIKIQIHMKTATQKILILKERLQKYIEGLPQIWYPNFYFVCEDIDDCTKIKMAVWIRHRLNFQEGAERYERRTKLLMHIKQQLEDLDITYVLPLQPVEVTGVPIIAPAPATCFT